MKLRPLAALGLLLLCSVAWVQGFAQPAPRFEPTAPAAGQPVRTINGVPDTGQFLPDTAILGRIDGRVFRVLEFRERWFASYLLDRPKADSAGRFQFLNSMVNKEVLAALAREVARPLNFEDRATLRETRQRLLSNATFARLIADSVRYTNDEVRHLYEQGKYQLHLQRIVASDPGTAERARADVLAGRLGWEEAARRYPKLRDQDLGWVRRDSLGPATALEIFDLPDGGVSTVRRAGTEWWFARVTARRPVVQPQFQQVARLLAQEILALKLAERTEALRAQMRTRIGMAYDTTNIAWAASLFAETERQVQSDDPTPVIDMTGAVPDFQPEDTSRVLARWRDGRFSLGDFLAIYNSTPVIGRDKVGSFVAFRDLLDRYVLEPYMAELAVERGLDRDSLVLAGMAKKEEQLRVEHLFADSVESRLWVSDQERRKYYEDHLPDFYGLQSVTYAAFGRPTRAGTDSLVARLRAGEPATDILHADSLAGLFLGAIKVEGERDAGEYHGLVFNELREGQIKVLGPDRQGAYLVLQKLVHDPGRQLTFQEVQGLVDESVQNLKAERMLQEFIARHRARHDIELYPERLMLVRLTDPRD
jgi:hypothetical protein